MSAPVRVLVVDDQRLLRRSLVTILDAAADVEVVGEADNGTSGVAVARAVRPDVVLMDIRMPAGLDGIAATEAICSDPGLGGTRVCVLTVFEEDAYVFRALQAGASGYLLKDTPPEGVVQAVRAVHAGGSLLSPGVLATVVAHAPSGGHGPTQLEALTPRQTEVLRLVASGLSNQEIEERLNVSHSTLKTHMGALLRRLGARDRAQLVIAAYEGGLMGSG
ncbi:DNA-binding response regulator [Actinomyces lilanjuaniae]|uniref:DNA-binding response regulator n=1 Tax=Actinomyces lilanjuaniae TaxID=2321394 RepID=A0ABN5PL42_9ACTO|nr:response regulator transcription factor [Actinomyces lilanjuaniae]AYD88871.1 DNA-binding response regulator [Actinomyces lilanjuaniae]